MDKAEFYGDSYEQFDEGTKKDNRIATLLDYLKGHQFDSFLDIGCGNGTLTLLFAKAIKAKQTKAIEISEKGTREARAKGIECVRADLDKDQLPFENETFDFVLCGEVIEHVFDPDRLLEYIHRVLKPGGKVIITTPNLAAWHSRLYLLLGYNPFWCSVSLKYHQAGKLLHISSGVGTGHIRFFTLKALEDLLGYHRISIKKKFGFFSVTAARIPAPLLMLLNGLERLSAQFPSLATMIGIVGEKVDR